MDINQRLSELCSLTGFEAAEDTSCGRLNSAAHDMNSMVSHAVLPNGKRIRLLKTLLTSACERNCYYCPFRAGRDFRRTTLSPDEMSKAFIRFHSVGIVDGIFLSSGIAGSGIRTQDKLIATAEILRRKYLFQGYIHLKLMPGVEKTQIEQAMLYANRVSINLEAPNQARLQSLAPRKEFNELIQPLLWSNEIRRNKDPHGTWSGRWPSTTTQFVVGAVGESDLELLTTTEGLYAKLGLARAYFSAFRPVIDTPFEGLPAESPTRELRLYQASFLLRDYPFSFEDLPFDADGSLPQGIDPKTAWAKENLENNPVEINSASLSDLLRIPGIGPKSAQQIIQNRKLQKFRSLDDLNRIHINPTKLSEYILLDGKQPSKQLSFF
jgi:predicted DNA-binding helix-hairpin-helix protein